MRRFRSGLEQKKNNIFYGDTLTKRVLSCILLMEKALFLHENNEADSGRRKKTAAAETKEGSHPDRFQ